MSEAKKKPAKAEGKEKAKANGEEKGKAKAKKKDGKKNGAITSPSVAGHPRGVTHVRRAKGWGGLVAFAICAYLSWKAGEPSVAVLERALLAGVAGYLLAWFAAVSIWRSLVLAELATLRERLGADEPGVATAGAAAVAAGARAGSPAAAPVPARTEAKPPAAAAKAPAPPGTGVGRRREQAPARQAA